MLLSFLERPCLLQAEIHLRRYPYHASTTPLPPVPDDDGEAPLSQRTADDPDLVTTGIF